MKQRNPQQSQQSRVGYLPPENPLVTTATTTTKRAGLVGLATAVSMMSFLLVPCVAAFTQHASHHRSLSSSLYASARVAKADTANVAWTVPQPVQPRSSSSQRQRAEAVEYMDRKRAENGTFKSVDARMLELLSDQFLYPERGQTKRDDHRHHQRPRGRPASVPGAMSLETLVKFQEQQIKETEYLSTIAPAASSSTTTVNSETATENVVQRKTRRGPKGNRGAASTTDAASSDEVVVPTKNQWASKVLPQKKDSKAVPAASCNSRNANADLQRFFRTELLTAEEEYSLGMKVHFMMKCEEVHEGLCEELGRLPSMEEWAEACGFTDPDPLFLEAEGDAQLRPAGAETMFEESDPNLFVGNGLAQEAGPGRGRGRVKKPPPARLNDFRDDTKVRFLDGRAIMKGPSKKKSGVIINRGTPTDFVETLFEAREAKQRMVQSNMRLVVSIARKYSNVGVNLQDLVQEGSLGLTRAAEKFEPKKGFKFSTYASWWIQQAVFRSIAYHSRTIRLPVHVHNLLNRVRRIRMSLEQGLGRSPTNEEMAEQLDMTVEKYNKMMRLTRRSISLELPKYSSNPKDLGHESEDLLGDTIDASAAVQDESTPEQGVDRGLFREDLKEMLQILEEDERRVICARYGLADGLTRTVTTVAAQMKQTKAWVRSQECRALRKLRRPWYEKRLKEHQDSLSS